MANPKGTPFKDEPVATNLRNYRKSRGVSLYTLADEVSKELKVNHVSLWSWELGRFSPSVYQIIKVCSALGIDAGPFMTTFLEFEEKPLPLNYSRDKRGRFVKKGVSNASV